MRVTPRREVGYKPGLHALSIRTVGFDKNGQHSLEIFHKTSPASLGMVRFQRQEAKRSLNELLTKK